jgi:choline-phosphate cytidylyltransferase
VSGYRKRDFDEKLMKMGHAELKAEGSDFDERSRPHSRIGERSTLGSRSVSASPKSCVLQT